MPKNVARTTRASNPYLHGSDPFSELCPFTGEPLREHDAPLFFGFTTDDSAAAVCDTLRVKPANRMQGRAVEGIVTALIVEHEGQGRATSYSRNREYPAYLAADRYRHDGFGYWPIRRAVDLLGDAGLISENRAKPGTTSRIQSTMWANPTLIDAMNGALILPVQPCELIELRDGDGVPQDYRDTAETERMRRDCRDFNDALGSALVTWSGGTFRNPYRRRVFTRDFRSNGRAYASGTSYQNIPKAERRSIRIGGAATVEADFSAMHIKMLYLEVGAKMDGDPYTIPGWPRDICKVALNVLLNATGEAAAVKAIAYKMIGDGSHPRQRDLQRARDLADALKRRHPRIADALHTGAGLRLMRKDSDIAARVQRHMHGRGEMVLTLHDGYRVRSRAIDDLREAMAKASKAVTGTEIRYTIDCRF